MYGDNGYQNQPAEGTQLNADANNYNNNNYNGSYNYNGNYSSNDYN